MEIKIVDVHIRLPLNKVKYSAQVQFRGTGIDDIAVWRELPKTQDVGPRFLIGVLKRISPLYLRVGARGLSGLQPNS
jgi:hypothetical protein